MRDAVEPDKMTPAEARKEALLETLGPTSGSVKSTLVSMFDYTKRNEGIALASAEQRNASNTDVTIAEFKKACSSVVFKSGKCSLNKPQLLQAVTDRERNERLELRKKRTKEKKKILTLKRDIELIRVKKGTDFEKWNKKELGKFLQYKKDKKLDGAMPKTFPELCEVAAAIKDRSSPTASPCSSDTENDEDSMAEDDAEEGVMHVESGASMEI